MQNSFCEKQFAIKYQDSASFYVMFLNRRCRSIPASTTLFTRVALILHFH